MPTEQTVLNQLRDLNTRAEQLATRYGRDNIGQYELLCKNFTAKLGANHPNINALRGMADVILGRGAVLQKNAEAIALSQLLVKRSQELNTSITFNDLSELYEKVAQAEEDQREKLLFFTTLNSSDNPMWTANAGESADLLAERITTIFYSQFKNKYKGNIELAGMALTVPVQFRNDSELVQLAKDDEWFFESDMLKNIAEKNSKDISKRIKAGLKDFTAKLSQAYAEVRQLVAKKPEKNIAKNDCLDKDLLRGSAEEAQEKVREVELERRPEAVIKSTRLLQLKDIVTFFNKRNANVEKFNSRLLKLKRLQETLQPLQEANVNLLKQHEREDLKSLKEQFKELFGSKEEITGQQFVKQHLSEQRAETENLEDAYAKAIAIFTEENADLKDKIDNIDAYKAAKSHVAENKLNREDVAAKFRAINLEKKIAIENEMFIPYENIARDTQPIIEGSITSEYRYRPFGMKEYLEELTDTTNFEESVASSKFVKFCEHNKKIKADLARFAKSSAVGLGFGGIIYGVSSIFMNKTASLILSFALAGSATAVAGRLLKKDDPNHSLGADAKAEYEKDLKDSMGEIANSPEFRKLSVDILKLEHYRRCLLLNLKGMRTEYLRKSGLDKMDPPKTEEQIDLAIEEFFVLSMTELLNTAFTKIYDLHDEEIEKYAQKTALGKVFAKIFTNPKTLEQDRKRFVREMIVDFVANTSNMLMNAAEEKTFFGKHNKFAASLSGFCFGLLAVGIALSVAVALTNPIGWTALFTSLTIISFAVASIPSSYVTYKCKPYFTYERVEKDRKGLMQANETFKNHSIRLKQYTDNVAKKTTQAHIEEAEGFADQVAKGEYKEARKVMKKLFGIDTKIPAAAAGDYWLRRYFIVHEDSKRIRIDLGKAFETIERKSSEQTNKLQMSLLTGRLRKQNYQPITEFCQETVDFLQNKKNAGIKRDYDLENAIKEQILQVVRVLGISGNNQVIDVNVIEKIPTELKKLYTETLGGTLDDLRTVIQMAEVEKLLPLAETLEQDMTRYPETILTGSNLYRTKLGREPVQQGFKTKDNKELAEKEITEKNIVSLMENSFKFLLSLNNKQVKPAFVSEYTHSIEYTLYKTILIKQLAELSDPNKKIFNPTLRGLIMKFIHENCQMSHKEVEEMFLQVQNQENITHTEQGYTLVKLNTEVDKDPELDGGLNLKNKLQNALPAYAWFGNKVYLMDKKTESLKCILTVEDDQLDREIILNSLAAIFTKAANELDRKPSVSTIINLQKLTKQPQDSSIPDALRVNLAFGLPKITPELWLRHAVENNVTDEKTGKKYKAFDFEKVFVFNKKILSEDLVPPSNATKEYVDTTNDYIGNTEAFINEMLKVVSYKDRNAPAIFVDTALLEVKGIKLMVETKLQAIAAIKQTTIDKAAKANRDADAAQAALDAAENEVNPVLPDGKTLENLQNEYELSLENVQIATRDEKSVLEAEASLITALESLTLHNANLQLYAAIIRMTKVEENKTQVVSPGSVAQFGVFGNVANHVRVDNAHPVASKTKSMSPKEATLYKLQQAVDSMDINDKNVTIVNSDISIAYVKRPKKVSDILPKEIFKDVITFEAPVKSLKPVPLVNQQVAAANQQPEQAVLAIV